MKEEKGIKENQVKVTYNSPISLAIIEAQWKMSFEVCSASSSFIANDLGEPGFARYIFKNPLQSPSLFYLSPMKFPCTRSPLSCRNLCTSWVQWDSESHNNWIIYHQLVIPLAQWNMKLAIGTTGIVVVWCINFKKKLEPSRVVAFCSSITTQVCVLEVGPPKPLGCLNEFQCILASLICYFHFMCRSISEKKNKDFFCFSPRKMDLVFNRKLKWSLSGSIHVRQVQCESRLSSQLDHDQVFSESERS